MKRSLLLAAAVAVLAAAGSAQAAVFSYSNDFTVAAGSEWDLSQVGQSQAHAGILGEFGGPGTSRISLSQNSTGSGSGTFSLDFLGYRSLDGYNCCTDEFVININGSELFRGAFDLGGGGGTSWTIASGGSVSSEFSSNGGRTRTITVPFTAVIGANTFDFSVGGGMEGIGNEGYGFDNVSFSANVTTPTPGVPEPASWALMILGFGATGLLLRRRQSPLAA